MFAEGSSRLSRVSVLVPAYNGRAYIAEALRSVFAQTRRPDEVLVADDASTDGTADVVEEVARDAPVPIRLLRQTRNSGGPARPLNAALEAASGELVAVLDQDDILLPGHLEELAGALEREPDAALAFAACGAYGNPEAPGARWQPPTLLRRLEALGSRKEGYFHVDGHAAARLLLTWGNYVVGYPGFVFRRDDWRRKGGLDEGLRVGSDYDLLLWLCLRGPVVYLPRRLYLRRTHGRNLTARGITSAVEVARVVRRYLGAVAADDADPRFRDDLGRHYLRLLGNLGWVRRHGEAARRLREATRARGWNGETPWAVARLAFTWAWCHLGRNGVVPRDGEVEEFLDHLNAIDARCGAE